MKYNRLGYIIGEGFSNVFKNKKSTSASLIIMCATMIIFGVFLAISENINHFVQKMEQDQGIQVFVNRDASDEEIEDVRTELNKIGGISKIEYRSKEAALNQVKEMLGDHQELVSGLTEEDNFLPASYVVKFTDLSQSEQVRQEIEKIDNIESIQSSDKTSQMLVKLANGIKIGTLVILVLLILISTFIISNTIKLTVHARKREISIMKYVGATNNFIRWPFIVEGIIIGVMSSLISILIIGLAYTWIAEQAIKTEFMQNLGINLVTFQDMFKSILITYLLLGTGIGMLGSTISMRKYLDV